MLFFSKKRAFALLTLFVVFLTIIGQIYMSFLSLIAAFGLFFVLIVWAALQDMVLPILLFFLPWSPLLKFSPEETSMYTLAIIVMLGVSALRAAKSAYIYHLFSALLLIGFTLVVREVNCYPISNNYIAFSAFLLLFPFLSKELRTRYDFFVLTVWFSAGIISAAVSAQRLMMFSGIARYVAIHDYLQYTVRLSGFYRDPNFYAVHITAALAGIMVLLSKEFVRTKRLFLYALMLLLLYCGLLSISKSFILIALCLFLFWIVQIFFQKGRISLKVMLLSSICIGCTFLLSSTLFSDLLENAFQRFRVEGGSFNALTTHRVEIWQIYINEMESNASLLMFGRGLTDILLADRASHNTIIQIIYQTGIIGSVMMLFWIGSFVHSLVRGIRINHNMLMPILILATGALGPWLALDMLFFDEFFLLPLYIGSGIYYLSICEKSSLEQLEAV